MMGKPFWIKMFCGKVRRVYFFLGMVMADENENVVSEAADKAIRAQQINRCTILSPDMSIQELSRLLTSVGLCLADVKIRPMWREKPRKPREVVVSGVVETKDVTESAW